MNSRTLVWPTRRNSFHPAWLLLPLPSLFQCVASLNNPFETLHPAHLVQFILALPYVLTVLLLAGFVGRAVAPQAIGVPYAKDK